MSASADAWARGLRRAASTLGLFAVNERVIVLSDPSTRALLFEVWRETIHEVYRADPAYDCDRWCWLRLTEEQQRERFTGSLSFETFLQILADALGARTTRAQQL
ncbi:hypothetical protein HY480_04315 [Candidatus Uhrbacteria bacterium]|nr:hypothetical protein [Candidatus Uhrbacteria bacterium]